MVTRTVYKTSKKDVIEHGDYIHQGLNSIRYWLNAEPQRKFIIRFEFVQQKDCKQVFAFRVYNTNPYTIVAGTSTENLAQHLSHFINEFINDKFEPFLISKNQDEELALCHKALESFFGVELHDYLFVDGGTTVLQFIYLPPKTKTNE